jgi:hypothetical protein
MPANGLIYNPPHPCACYLESKMYGFHALAPQAGEPLPALAVEARLERGPAHDAQIEGRPVDGVTAAKGMFGLATTQGDLLCFGSTPSLARQGL